MRRPTHYSVCPIAVAAILVGASLATPTDAAACRTTIGDFVWVDSNRNGLQDAGEGGINGVTLILTAANGVQDPRSTVTGNHPVTGAPGWYSFDRITCAIDYTVRVDAGSVPAGYSPTLLHVGSNREVDSNDPAGVSVNIPYADQNPPADLSIDFGYLTQCTGAIGNFVWLDTNRNGLQDSGEPAIANAVVSLDSNPPTTTDQNGFYSFTGLCAGTYRVTVQVPPGTEATLTDQGSNDQIDSDGSSDGLGGSTATVTLPTDNTIDNSIDFGFVASTTQVGTGTPGYWKNHPEAWPVDSIVIGGRTYTKAQALAILDMPDGGDKSLTLFRALISAKLNLLIGTESSCIAGTVALADSWMTTYPATSKVKASSAAWKIGEPLYRTLDNYNNGMLCAPHRD